MLPLNAASTRRDAPPAGRGSTPPRWRPRLAVWPALCLLLLAAPGLAVGADRTQSSGPPPGDCRSLGPWYTDLAGHWAETYVRVLWWEGVTTPPLSHHAGGTAETWTYPGPYRPDTGVLRSIFGTMLVRVFPGNPFVPPPAVVDLARPSESGLARQEAVATLIDALGLGDFARGLDPTVAATYLRQFADAASVSPSQRQTMAVAILLGIIKGYPDNTIQPRRMLTRAEGATVIYRSCLLLADARPNPFSPDGDGAEDVTTIALGSLLNRNARNWDLTILDSVGKVLRHLKPPGSGPAPPASVNWAGETDGGLLLTPGTYYYRGWLQDREGRVFWSALKPIVLETKSLLGFARPAVVLPGEEVTLSAVASGGPSQVTATLSSFPGAGTLVLASSGASSRRWEVAFTVPVGSEPGPCTVGFLARYPASTRTASAGFRVGRFAVRGDLEPNPVRAGQPVEVGALPNLHPDGCQATLELPGGDVTLNLRRAGRIAGQERWKDQTVVPPETPAGRYRVLVVATLGRAMARDELWLTVTRPDSALTFILSD